MSENKSRLGHEKAQWAVDRARAELQKIGYSVKEPNSVCAVGPDLIMDRRQKPFGWITVEVKLAMWNVGSKAGAWRVNRVTRKKDDYIAIVFPSGVVHFEWMRDHLKFCNKSGDRYLTNLGRLFE